jgi:outer membrane biosynthesis protein TonB
MGESAAGNQRSGTGADESAGRVTSGRAFPNISGGVLNGKAVALPKPQYPAAARAVKAAGEVNVQVLISEDGQVFSAGAVSGHPLLRSASQLAACGAQFTPVLLSGTPVKVSGIIVYNIVP